VGMEVQIHACFTSTLEREMNGQLHDPAALPPEKDPLVPLG